MALKTKDSKKEILDKALKRQKDQTDPSKSYAIFYGKDHDLLISLPYSSRLTKNYKIYFSKTQSNYCIATIYSGKYTYKLLFSNELNLLFDENGYYCIKGRYPQQKGLHNQPLHRLAYIAFYGQPKPGYHIHHIDKDKHNNGMDNLVALTEEEHSIVHGRDVSVGKTLFNNSNIKTRRRDLLNAYIEQQQAESRDGTKAITESFEQQMLQRAEDIIQNQLSNQNNKTGVTYEFEIDFDKKNKKDEAEQIRQQIMDKLDDPNASALDIIKRIRFRLREMDKDMIVLQQMLENN